MLYVLNTGTFTRESIIYIYVLNTGIITIESTRVIRLKTGFYTRESIRENVLNTRVLNQGKHEANEF